MNFSETSASLFNNAWFRDRVRMAISKYSTYLLNIGTGDPDYAAKVAAGQRLATQNEAVLSTVMFTLSGDDEVKNAGPAIDDALLQTLVEKTILMFYPITPAVATIPPIGVPLFTAPGPPSKQ